jgi:hypothetical protein
VVAALPAGPADRPAGPQVDHRGQVEPALAGAELGEIGGPQLIRPGRAGSSLHQVRGAGITEPGSAPPPPGVHPGQPTLPHQAGHPLAAAAHAQPRQLAVHPGCPYVRRDRA